MQYCPICERTYGDEAKVCEVDGAVLRDSGTKQDPLIGKIIRGRYRVLEKLGEGGMGTVYLAEQIAINRKVALKILHPDYARDQEFVRRFRQEARLAAALNHRNIITVFDFDQADDGSLYIVMEYVAGKSLSALIQHGPIELTTAVRLAIQIAEGLRAAHAAGVIHRDIKPENIMVVGEDEIKLMDFGIARLSNTEGATRLTRSGMIMGTPAYMAPEQIEGGDVGEATDIYAFGIVLYEMLSGRVPFAAPTPGAILIKHLQEVPDSLRKLRKEVPASLENVVKQALEKKPEQRQKSMSEVADLLARAQRQTLLRRESSSSLGRQLSTAGQRLTSISTLLRRLLERVTPQAGAKTEPAAEPEPQQQRSASAEDLSIPLEEGGTVAETKPLTSYEANESGSSITAAPEDRMPMPPAGSISSGEPAGTELIETQALVQSQQTAETFSTEPMATPTLTADQSLTEIATITATQPLGRAKTATRLRPALGIAAAAVIAVAGVIVYRQMSSEPARTTPPQHENAMARSSPAKVELSQREIPHTADIDTEQPLKSSLQNTATTDAPPSVKAASEKALVLATPPALSEINTRKKPEAPKSARKNEKTEIAKLAPAPETPPAKKVIQEEVKVTAKPIPTDLDQYKKPAPVQKPEPAKTEAVKKEPETKLASIDKPAIKQPQTPPPLLENRLLSLMIISAKRDINVKERIPLTVRGKYSDGKENEIVTGVRFESSDANVAAVNSRGEIEGKKEGKAQVTARYAGVVSGVYTFYVKGVPEKAKEDQSGERLQDLRRRLLR